MYFIILNNENNMTGTKIQSMFMSSFKGIYWRSSWKASHRQEQKWSGLNVVIYHMIFTGIQAFNWTLSICWIGCNRCAALATGRYYHSERTSFAAYQHYGGKSFSVRTLNYQDTCRDLTNVQLPNTHLIHPSSIQRDWNPVPWIHSHAEGPANQMESLDSQVHFSTRILS